MWVKSCKVIITFCKMKLLSLCKSVIQQSEGLYKCFWGGVWGVGQSEEALSHFVEPWILSESSNINFLNYNVNFAY